MRCICKVPLPPLYCQIGWNHPPQIGCVAQEDGCILVAATDDVLVTRVKVTILDGDGCVLEAGEAVRQEGDWWVFVSPAVGKTVIAEACDLPGNTTRLVLEQVSALSVRQWSPTLPKD